jgi:S1-C subfamily serine protease
VTDSLVTVSDGLAGAVEAADPFVARVAGGRRPATGLVWSADGVIVATEHTVRRDEDIVVTLGDGRELPATVVGRDPSTDLAVLRTQATGLPVPVWRDTDGLQAGQLVLALGRPGRTVRAWLGILSAVGHTWQIPGGTHIDRYLEPDIEPARGISGGPLLDAGGRVIGLNTTGLMRGTVLTMPSTTLRRVTEALLTYGRVRRGYLGVAAQAVLLPPALEQAAHQRAGLLVHAVEPDSPADRAGLMIGDLVLTVGGQPVRRPDELLELLTGDRIGAAVPIRLSRAGQIHEVQAVIIDRPAPA